MAASAISIAGKVLAVVGKPVFQEIYLIWGYRSQLDDLEHTLNTIKGVLLDAESKDDLSEVTKVYVKQLSRAVYDADDLFDEFHTVAELKKVGNLSETVCYFFSSMNSLFFAYSMSQGVRKMRNKLDNIANNRNQFGLSVHSQPNRRRREETSSQFPDEVVGREGDVNMVVSKLLDSSHEERVSFLSIVGIGGMGKTTLAQLVFNDDRVKSEFPLRVWTYACDENATDFVKKISTNILKSVDSSSNHDALSLEVLQGKLRVLLGGKKFLLVLDDLWNENQNNWDVSKRLLMVGGTGSRVLVTTRSGMAANIVSDKNKYELKGLSPKESWRLFKIKAFGNESENTHNTNNSELVKLGEKIVKMCSNVPLAIRVVGTLLRGENESKWRSVLEQGLASLG